MNINNSEILFFPNHLTANQLTFNHFSGIQPADYHLTYPTVSIHPEHHFHRQFG